MLEATFERAYPIARRAVQVRARAAVISGIIPLADREDFEQEGLTACWRALPHFDPARASLRTFVEHVIAARLASIVRSARRAPVLLPLESASTMRIAGDASRQELRAGVMRLLDRLGASDRHLVHLLLDNSPAEASRILGVPRSTLHDQVVRLRRRFSVAGLGASGGGR